MRGGESQAKNVVPLFSPPSSPFESFAKVDLAHLSLSLSLRPYPQQKGRGEKLERERAPGVCGLRVGSINDGR